MFIGLETGVPCSKKHTTDLKAPIMQYFSASAVLYGPEWRVLGFSMQLGSSLVLL